MTEADFRNLKERVHSLEAAVVRLAERDRASFGSERRAPQPTDNPFYQEWLLTQSRRV